MDSTFAMDPQLLDPTGSTSATSMMKKLKQNDVAMADASKNPASEAEAFNGSDDCNEDNSDYDDVNDNADDYDDDYDDDDDDDDQFYTNLQEQFDSVDLPPGVEASVSWLKESAPSGSITNPVSSSTFPSSKTQFNGSNTDSSKNLTIGTSASSSSVSGNANEVINREDEVQRKYQLFKRFDTVDDFSDHYYNNLGFLGNQPPKEWLKKIQEEWKILENDLPDTIFVRVYESRMDLLRAVIVGAAGTPYQDGLFVFDVLFPPTYPTIPPMVYYYSGGLRLNPNLYDCGKVCLSLLNTWTGKNNEMWDPKQSTMLQVLVSIQALILNANPFFNEPGYESRYLGEDGERMSKRYNEDVFILSLKTMMYTLRRPPKHFEDLVAGHFLNQAYNILLLCKSYMESAQAKRSARDKKDFDMMLGRNGVSDFKGALSKMNNILITLFTKNGSKDCEQFQIPV